MYHVSSCNETKREEGAELNDGVSKNEVRHRGKEQAAVWQGGKSVVVSLFFLPANRNT